MSWERFTGFAAAKIHRLYGRHQTKFRVGCLVRCVNTGGLFEVLEPTLLTVYHANCVKVKSITTGGEMYLDIRRLEIVSPLDALGDQAE